MSSELLALIVMVVVHLIAIGALLGMLLEDRGGLGGWWPTDDPGDDGPGGPPEPDGPRRPGGALPLPGAAPARVRLRGPARLADAHRRPRRPAREPAPAPAREPARR
jgi:hypothetical protein